MENKKTNEKFEIVRSFENQSDQEMVLSGYAATFEDITTIYKRDGIEFKEVIDKNAFDGANMKDCCLKYNHSDNVPILARTRGDSLKLNVDDKGLFFVANLFDTSTSRDVYTLVKQGGLDKCSFAFTISEQGGDIYDPKTRTRRITKISKLWDVSIVNNPAYDSTTVSARSKEFFDAEAEKERMELRELELRKKKLMLLLELSGKESR